MGPRCKGGTFSTHITHSSEYGVGGFAAWDDRTFARLSGSDPLHLSVTTQTCCVPAEVRGADPESFHQLRERGDLAVEMMDRAFGASGGGAGESKGTKRRR